MRQLLDNRYVALLARLVLGFIFVAASIEKVADPNAFAASVDYYRILPHQGSLLVATVLPWLELIAGLFLIFGIWIRGSSLLVLLMLIFFTAGVITALFRGLDISCGCFSRDPAVDKIGWMKVLENIGLMFLACVPLFSNTTRFALKHSVVLSWSEQPMKSQPPLSQPSVTSSPSKEVKPKSKWKRKLLVWIFVLLLVPFLALMAYTWVAMSWSYSSGERAGYVQKFSKKGWIWKTWEGELAMVNLPGTMPEKFEFSVLSDSVATQINQTLGRRVTLTYEQHKGVPLSYFGETEYFVDAVRVIE